LLALCFNSAVMSSTSAPIFGQKTRRFTRNSTRTTTLLRISWRSRSTGRPSFIDPRSSRLRSLPRPVVIPPAFSFLRFLCSEPDSSNQPGSSPIPSAV
jgi:hypothetical protein